MSEIIFACISLSDSQLTILHSHISNYLLINLNNFFKIWSRRLCLVILFKVGGVKSHIFLLLISWQVLVSFYHLSAWFSMALAFRHVVHIIIGHCIVVMQFFSLLDISKSHVKPIFAIEADSSVGLTWMINTPSKLSKANPFLPSHLTGMNVIRGVGNLNFTDQDHLSFVEWFFCVETLPLFLRDSHLTIVLWH